MASWKSLPAAPPVDAGNSSWDKYPLAPDSLRLILTRNSARPNGLADRRACDQIVLAAIHAREAGPILEALADVIGIPADRNWFQFASLSLVLFVERLKGS